MYRYTYAQNLLLRPSEGLTNYRQGEQRAADRGVRAADMGCKISGQVGVRAADRGVRAADRG